MSNILLECIDLIKIYESKSQIKVPALRGIDLAINQGELLAIIGPSGAGKSTFIRVLGLIENLSSGEIIYNGFQGQLKYSQASFSDRLWFRREVCGYLFQLPEQNLLYNLNVLQNVLFPMQVVNKLPHEAQKTRALELLTLIGLKHRISYLPAKLSGGEAQRVGICVALANDPQLFLADEPTGELDSMNTQTVIQYFRDLNRDWGKTILVVTHDRRFSKMTDKIYRIQNGKLTSIYTPLKKDREEREELIPVSDIGEMIIPEYLCQQFSLKRMVKIKRNQNYLNIFPKGISGPPRPSHESDEWEEFTAISNDGLIILPSLIRKQLGIQNKVKLIAESDHITIIPIT